MFGHARAARKYWFKASGAAAAGGDASAIHYAELVEELGLTGEAMIVASDPVNGDRLVELFKREDAAARRPGEAAKREARISKPEFRSALLRLGLHATHAELE